ncbi:MAG: bacterioferritin [Deltaproteobacteria bacterium CG11_big_fil_rev_8_21_14_0_20_45_16]|nr:MAG: bacterioferritin [Deltaproteobacteria bacterium CG11_big_fil_rev_8_21_14_0_20_45_16]
MTNEEKSFQNKSILELLSEIYRAEMAGINRYLHYSFMIMGHNRIPIQKWFRANAEENMAHAVEVGEKITSLGGHPPMVSAQVEESNLHTVQQLLEESLKFELEAIGLYKKLVAAASECGDIALEELARSFVKNEVEHTDEVRKMMRRPD